MAKKKFYRARAQASLDFCLTLALTPSLLYLAFRLSLSCCDGTGRWICPPACRQEGSGADEFDSLRHWLLAKCVGSRNRSCSCPKLEPLIERPSKSQLVLQE